MRKEIELMQNCDNEHDRKLMAQKLIEHHMNMKRAYMWVAIGLVLIVGGFIGMELVVDDIGILVCSLSAIIGAFTIIIGAIIGPLRNAGLA